MDPKATIDCVAEIMDEFRLSEARWQSGELSIAFRRRPAARTAPSEVLELEISESIELVQSSPSAPVAPKGIPVVSPMNGIYYGAPNPGSPPFVRPGDPVSAGQIIGLIEAMKVFNEIPCPLTGVVVEVIAQTSQIVNPGDILLYIE